MQAIARVRDLIRPLSIYAQLIDAFRASFFQFDSPNGTWPNMLSFIIIEIFLRDDQTYR